MTIRLGLRANAAQFSILVGLNALVGAMVGLERSVLPLVGEEEFGLVSRAAILSFVVAFGVAKAFTNLGAGVLADRVGRKRLLRLSGFLTRLLLGSDLAAITSRSQRVANRRFKESADWAPRVANAREGLRLLTG